MTMTIDCSPQYNVKGKLTVQLTLSLDNELQHTTNVCLNMEDKPPSLSLVPLSSAVTVLVIKPL